MRVLFLTSRLPGPLFRGDQLRAYHHLRQLSTRHRITLVAVHDAAPDPARIAALETYCERVIVVRRPAAEMAWRALAALPSQLPLQAAIYDFGALRAALAALLSETEFDLAHVQLARLGPHLARLHPLPCVLDFIDALSVNMARRATFDRGFFGLAARLETPRLAA
ncbi:MAG: hypothetical protein EXR86_12820 [Gammaproteobacteria bacterium]|nr:hypothetical protein [Gammaproteobacteria bacterium]